MIRPMRGQVVIQELEDRPSAILWTPAPGARQIVTHRGRVLALGPPARTRWGHEVDYGFGPGDLVQFHFEFLEKLARNPWTLPDGTEIEALWIPQSDVDGVWYEEVILPGRIDHVLCTIGFDPGSEVKE